MKHDITNCFDAGKNLPDTAAECSDMVKIVADSVPEPVIILNNDRRLVWQNNTALSVFAGNDSRKLIMQLPGNVFGCAGINEQTECGSGRFCQYCGANNAFQNALGGDKCTKECSILKKDGELMELRVTATPLRMNGGLFIFVYVKDLSDTKRKAVLERLFFHDIMNMISGFSTMSDLLEVTDDLTELKEIIPLMRMTTVSLTEEIRSHKLIFEAENGDLAVIKEKISSSDILDEVKSVYSASSVCIDKSIVIDERSENVGFVSDKTILRRVLGNLIKNALEATPAGGKIIIASCSADKGGVTFSVHNKEVIPDAVQATLFHKSISTKGDGRGLGTHSVKLLTEKFLKGRVSFTSSQAGGTTFFVTYPKAI